MAAPQEDMLDQDVERSSERREFFRSALGAAAVAATGVAAVSIGAIASAATVADSDILNFALQVEYLLAQYYGVASGVGPLAAGQLTAGSTATGTNVAGAATGAAAVSFTDANVAQIVREIALEKAAHVALLRTATGTDVAAQPAIDLGVTASGAFSTAMRAAGVITGSTSTFDVYANDGNFLLGAFLLEDVITSAYRAILSSVGDATNRESVAGLLGASAYHASAIRTLLYAKGSVSGSTLRANADAISDARDKLDGVPGDDDQGISPATVDAKLVSNIPPAGADGLAFGRGSAFVLNILYLNSASVSKGGFYPAGVNGTIVASSQN
ncbi:ferritin-like domain-containing protein [Sphingomonas immobilis]|uniref:Ferritin-like domain-containing protein n=1 Tax=Sphingomonas immobilis TaxID=3063997 RepID=A0ABT8ZVN7_9SPHN|nr:ferritin-like domain-containing protein [Sphingomonas sp. CA1-15]MDO7841629.1 ferritin-like domain-containing protein [Sphingomonas sp. CA1-15]